MNEWDEISVLVEVRAAAPYHDEVRQRVLYDIETMKIIGEFYEYYDSSYLNGEKKVKDIIQGLVEKYPSRSFKTVKGYVYPLPKSYKSQPD